MYREKDIAELLQKGLFKVGITVDIAINARIFNFHFLDKVENVGGDKIYEKSWFVI